MTLVAVRKEGGDELRAGLIDQRDLPAFGWDFMVRNVPISLWRSLSGPHSDAKRLPQKEGIVQADSLEGNRGRDR